MKNLFDQPTVAETIQRMDHLTPATQHLWGKMTAPQALAHCSIALEMAVGDRKPDRLFIGRILGPIFKGLALNEKPLAKNSPTDPSFVVADPRDLDPERARLAGLIQRFQAGGPAACTDHPHSFFGPLTPDQWARQQWKHIDHHLQQFGV